MKKEAALVLLCYAMVYLVWGSTYFFIKAAVTSIPAALVVALRFLSGSLILGLIAWRSGGFAKRPSGKEFAGAALIGVLLLLLGNGLITIAEKTIPSYTASLIVACMPFYVALFNLALYRERISLVRSSGAALGVIGIAALLYDGTSLAASLSPAVLIAVAGALAWGLGTSLAKAVPKPANVFASTSVQMLVAGLAALTLGFVSEPGILSRLGQASAWSLFGVAYLAVLGSLTLVAYNYLLVKEPSFRISSYSLVNPLIAVLIGLGSGEAASPYLALGIALVLAGLVLMLYGDALREGLRRGAAG